MHRVGGVVAILGRSSGSFWSYPVKGKPEAARGAERRRREHRTGEDLGVAEPLVARRNPRPAGVHDTHHHGYLKISSRQCRGNESDSVTFPR